ncbi:MAG: hypothetical protein ABW185_15375 [Sedimenticola sp.]
MAMPETVETIRPQVRCPTCQTVIFNGLVIKSRVLRLLPAGAEAKCRCKAWVPVPVVYSRSATR